MKLIKGITSCDDSGKKKPASKKKPAKKPKKR